jgi:hypothetical protein
VGTTAQDEYSKLCNDLLSLLQTGQAPQLDAMRARMQRLSTNGVLKSAFSCASSWRD